MNPIISVFDETYNQDYSDTYILNLYSCSDFLACSVIDSVRKKFVALRAFSTDDKFFNDQVAEDTCLTGKYKKVNAVFHSNMSVLIPAPIATDESVGKIFSLTFGESINGGKIISDKVNENITAAFLVPDGFIESLKNYSSCRIIHPYSVMINNAIKNSRKGNYMVCELYKKGVIIVCAVNSELLYCNYFACSESVDFAYHITGIYKNLDLSLTDVTLYYSGITEKKDDRISELQRFIRNVKPATATTDYLFSYRFNEFQKHFLTILYDAHNENNQR